MHQVLDFGELELLDVMGGDLSVVNAARVSFLQHHHGIEDGDEKLIHFLLKNRHGTPFEHIVFQWRIKCPLFVAREWHRHRIGSFNEVSGRYVELAAEYYVPQAVRIQAGKPGAYSFSHSEDGVENMWMRSKVHEASRAAFAYYKKLLEHGVAKEQARIVLPVNTYTQFYWTVNARALMNFLSLRNADTAMYEIRQYAQVMEYEFKMAAPITHAAFIDNGRLAP